MADQDRSYRRLTGGALLVAAAIVLAACGSAGTKGAASTHKPGKIAPGTAPSSSIPSQSTTTTSTPLPTTTAPGSTAPAASTSPKPAAAPSPTTTVAPKTLPATTTPGSAPVSPVPTSPPANSVMINSVHTSLGTVLVDQDGYVLYLLTADTPNSSNCTSLLCNTVWPAVLASGGGVAGAGVQQSLLGKLQLPNGTTQVTYGGHPLYTYVGDGKPAQTAGQGIKSFGGIWWVLSAATGSAITGALSML